MHQVFDFRAAFVKNPFSTGCKTVSLSKMYSKKEIREKTLTVFTPVFPCMSLSLRAITSSTEEEDNLSLAKALKKTMKNGRSFFSGTFNVFSLSVCVCARERCYGWRCE